MRQILQNSDAFDLRIFSCKMMMLTKQLTGDAIVDTDGPMGHFLDPMGQDRNVTLPPADEGLYFVISNIGTSGDLFVNDANGVEVSHLPPGTSNWVYSKGGSWVGFLSGGSTHPFGPVGPDHEMGLVPDPGPIPSGLRFLGDDGLWHASGGTTVNDAYTHFSDGTTTTIASGLDTFRFRSSDATVALTVQDNNATFGDNLNLRVNTNAIDHDALLNFVGNEHIDHSTVSITAGTGLTGGGTLVATRTLGLSLGSLPSQTPALADTMPFDKAGAASKCTFTVLNGILLHNSLAGYSANEHVDHTTVSINAGTGLTGGGNISASRTLGINIPGLSSLVGGVAPTDEVILWDASASQHVRTTISTIGGIPEAPTDGQQYARQNAAWAVVGSASAAATLYVQATAPASPAANAMWWNTTDGVLYIYYFDGNSSQWVEATPSGAMTATEILNALKTVDGSGSGLDADFLDGLDSTALGGGGGGSGDVSGPGAAVVGNFASFNNINGKVITDSGKKAADFADAVHSHTFASLTSKPTTISGFGITDAYTKSEVDTAMNGKFSTAGGSLSGALTLPQGAAGTPSLMFGSATLTGIYGNAAGNQVNVSSSGTLRFTFSTTNTSAVALNVPDVAYSGAWDGDLSVPTKNAVYDKIQTIPLGDVLGPATNADNRIATFNGVNSKTLKDSGFLITDLVAKAGDTMSGNLTIAKASPSFELSANAGSGSTMYFTVAGSRRWGFDIDATNADFAYRRYDNSGAHIGAAMLISRSTGVATFSNNVVVPDAAYGAGWDGDFSVPTKNAVYDKIESLIVGGGGGISDAPNDGKPYVRKSAAWDDFTDDMALKADLASPTFTGTVTMSGATSVLVPTASSLTNSTIAASTAFVQGQVATLNSAISSLAPIASPVLTGNPQSVTPSAGDNDTSIATTAFVQTELANSRIANIEFIIDGGGSTITTGQKGHLEISFACTINQVTLLADASGSIVVDIWKDTYANFPPAVGDSICASAKPTLTSNQKSQDATLTSWTKTVAAGDILAFNVDSATTVQRVTVSLKVTKS